MKNGSEFINSIMFQKMQFVGRGTGHIFEKYLLAKCFIQFLLHYNMNHFGNPTFSFNVICKKPEFCTIIFFRKVF